MAGHRGIPHRQVTSLGFPEQSLAFPPNIHVEMADSAIEGSKTNFAIAVEGQRLVQEIVQKATGLIKTLQDCEVLNVEKAGSKERQQRLSRTCQETLDNMKELFSQLRAVYEESKRRMPEVCQVLSSGNIEHLLPLADDLNQAGNEGMEVQDLEKECLIKAVQEQNLKIKTLTEKFQTLIQDLNLIVQLETSQ